MTSWHRSGWARRSGVTRPEKAKVTPGPRCKEAAAPRSFAGRSALMASGAALILALGFMLGANSEHVKRSVAYRVTALGLTEPTWDAGTAYAAYEKGYHACALRLAQPLAEKGDARAQSLVGLLY